MGACKIILYMCLNFDFIFTFLLPFSINISRKSLQTIVQKLKQSHPVRATCVFTPQITSHRYCIYNAKTHSINSIVIKIRSSLLRSMCLNVLKKDMNLFLLHLYSEEAIKTPPFFLIRKANIKKAQWSNG